MVIISLFVPLTPSGRIGHITIAGDDKTPTVVLIVVYAEQAGLDNKAWHQTIKELENLLREQQLRDPDTIVIVGGDFNCYLGRRNGGVTLLGREGVYQV